MKKEEIKHLEGKRVSVIIRGVDRNVSGVLSIGDDAVTVKQVSNKIAEVIISLEDIVSILVSEEKQWKNKECATYA